MRKLMLRPGFKKPSVVVEIGNDWLKILEYNASYKGGCITRANFVKLVQIKEPVTEAVSRAFKDLKLSKQGVIACIPRHLVTVRILEFPSIDPKEINDMVLLQVGKQTPYSREEIIFTYRPIQIEREGYTKVMLVIARRNIVNARVEVLQNAGIEVDKVAVSSEGAYNWFLGAYGAQIKHSIDATILLDIDSNYSDFIVINKAQFAYTRNILIGANHLLEDSEKWRDKFIEEVGHSIELFRNEEHEVGINKLFISGAGKHIDDLDYVLSAKLDMPSEKIDPLHNLNIREDIKVFNDDDCVFVSSSSLLGMSIQPKDLRLDLTSSELKIQKGVEGRRRQIMFMGVVVTSIIMMISFFLVMKIYNKNMYLSQIKKQIARNAKVAGEVERMREYIDLVKGRLNAKKRSLTYIYEIHTLTPREIYFTNIDVDEKKQVVLQGNADAMSNVFSFVTTLENSPYFENVKTIYTTTKKEEGREYARFEIVCMYERDELE